MAADQQVMQTTIERALPGKTRAALATQERAAAGGIER